MQKVLFHCRKFKPDLFATMVPATALFKTWVVDTGIPKPSAAAIVLIATSSADIPDHKSYGSYQYARRQSQQSASNPPSYLNRAQSATATLTQFGMYCRNESRLLRYSFTTLAWSLSISGKAFALSNRLKVVVLKYISLRISLWQQPQGMAFKSPCWQRAHPNVPSCLQVQEQLQVFALWSEYI